MQRLEDLRAISKEDFRVEFVAWEEDLDPADTIHFGDDDDAKQAEVEYFSKIQSGEYPWFCLGVHVFDTSGPIEKEVGTSYLGGVDTYDLHGIGVRDLVHEAIRESREVMADERLSRAAPALLEALEIMVWAFNTTDPDPLVAMASIERARAAIAQATEPTPCK